jgi:glycosyltransferase involved in cell wall biosynthesis
LSNQKTIKILFFIQLPPPVHGVSIVNKQVYDSEVINKGIVKSLLEIRFSNQLSQLRKLTIYKILHLIRLTFQLAGRLISFHPDFIYFSIMPVGKGFWRDLIFVIIIKLFRATPVYHLHNKGIEKKSRFLLMKWIYRFVFRKSLVIHLSENLMQTEILSLGLNKIKTRVIPNGIKKDLIPENPGRTDRFNILYLSNLFPEKGFLELIEVFGKLANENPDIYLDIIGGFPNQKIRKRIKQQIILSGFGNRISLKGPRYGEEKRKIYSEADLFVFPSFFRQECFPLVILEAMQAGLPIITTREGAIPEIIDNEVNGIIINQKDNKELESQIKRLIGDSNLRSSLGKAAREKFEKNFTLDHFEKNMRNFFEDELIKKE